MRSNVISIIKEPSSSPSASAMLSLSPPIIISQFKIIPIDDSFTSVLFILLNTLVCHSTPTGLPSYIKLPPSTVGVPSHPPIPVVRSTVSWLVPILPHPYVVHYSCSSSRSSYLVFASLDQIESNQAFLHL
ncbi:hypothetical protein ACMYSQ_001158 [Aspergillus niger]